MSVEDSSLASTRPSAPRAGQTAPAGLPHTTTLPGVQWSASGAQLEARTMPRYETIDLLGTGGMGEVARARDNDIGREVAVKRLRVEQQHQPDLLARFVEEVRTVGQLEHPNIVPIHDAGLDADGAYFVMKRVEGESVEAIIRKLAGGDRAAHARWPIERRLDVIRKVLEALRYAHGKGVIHRDVKPANILVGPLREVFLLDWGIARRDRGAPDAANGEGASPFHTHAGAVMGTPMYMSPEQARGEPADARSDLYSLCVTAYEFLTLVHPHAQHRDLQSVLAAVRDEKPRFASLVRHPAQHAVPMDLAWLLSKGLEKDPAARFASADALIARLDDRAEGKVPVQCHVTATKRLSYEVVRLINKSPPAYSAALLLLVAAALYFALR